MKPISVMLLAVALTVPALGSYTYVITDGMDFGGKTLGSGESLLMTGGGGHSLSLGNGSFALIQGTAPYNQDVYPSGGIYDIGVGGHLDFSGGEVYRIGVTAYGKATLSGGTIQRLQTSQSVYGQIDPYVTIICKEWDYNTTTKMLTGKWLDGLDFSIQLIDVAGYTPTINNITFIPEPASLVLIGLGGLLIRRRK